MGKNRKRRKSMREKTRQKANESGNIVANYIRLPQGFDLLNLEDTIKDHKKTKKVPFDIIPFEVTESHPFDEESSGEMLGDLWWRYHFYAHNNIGAEEKKYACLRSFGKKCPICLERKRLMDSDEVDEKVTDALRAKTRELYFVSVDKMKTAQIWDMSHYLFMKGLDKEVKTGDEELADFPEVEGGFTVITRFEEKAFNGGTYYEADRYDFDSRKDVPEELLDSLPDLASCVIELTFEKLEAIFYDTDIPGDEDEEEEKEENPRRRSHRDKDEESSGDESGEEESEEEEDSGEDEADEDEGGEASDEEEGGVEEEEECPIDDGVYGAEWDEWDGCEDCEKFDECKVEHDRLKKVGRKRKS